MGLSWIDTHCHLDAPEFDRDRTEVMARAQAAGVSTLVVPAVTAEPVLRVCDVSLQYRSERVPQLKSVSFELRPGEVLAVIGPSGAGKSTMCGGLLGEVRMVGGAMSLAGVDLAQSRTQASHLISFVPQQPAMFRDLTVRESLSHVANMRLASDMRAPERAARVTEVIAAMALTADADKPIKDLSGGQLKRASTAMELLSTPVLLILDEPTSGLDEGLDRAMMDTLKIAADKDGLAVIVITHSMVNLDKVDKVLALTGQGRLAFLGPPGELLSAFGVTSFAAAMDALRADKRVPVPAVSAPTAAPAVDVTPSRPLKGSMRNHLRELIRRELSRMWIARKTNVQLLAVGVLGTALLTLVASPEGLRGDPTAISATLITFIVCMAFFSMVPSFSAIVDDRDVVEREARWSVSASSVIISRALTCGLVAAPLSFVTTAAYVLLTWNKRPVDPLLPHPAGLFLFAFLLAVAAMCVGLLISAVSRSLRAAVFVLMSVLALHVVLTGLAPQFVGSTAWFMKDIAAFVPSRWASGGLGADYGLTQSRPAPTGAGGATSIPSPFADAIWTHDTWHCLERMTRRRFLPRSIRGSRLTSNPKQERSARDPTAIATRRETSSPPRKCRRSRRPTRFRCRPRKASSRCPP